MSPIVHRYRMSHINESYFRHLEHVAYKWKIFRIAMFRNGVRPGQKFWLKTILVQNCPSSKLPGPELSWLIITLLKFGSECSDLWYDHDHDHSVWSWTKVRKSDFRKLISSGFQNKIDVQIKNLNWDSHSEGWFQIFKIILLFAIPSCPGNCVHKIVDSDEYKNFSG